MFNMASYPNPQKDAFAEQESFSNAFNSGLETFRMRSRVGIVVEVESSDSEGWTEGIGGINDWGVWVGRFASQATAVWKDGAIIDQLTAAGAPQNVGMFGARGPLTADVTPF